MHWKNYRESQGSPAGHEVIITHDERDEGHPFIRGRVALYTLNGKRVTVKIAKQLGAKKNDPKKKAISKNPPAHVRKDIEQAQARPPRSVVAQGSQSPAAGLRSGRVCGPD